MLKLVLAIPYVLVVAAVGSIWLARQHRRQLRQPGALWVARSLEACAAWMLLDAASFFATDPAIQELARKTIWPVAVFASLFFFRFACAQGQQRSWWKAVRAPLIVAIAIDLVLMPTNAYHHLIWRESQWIELGSTRIPKLEPGLAFYWLQTPMCYGLLLGGVLALFVHAIESQTFYARRIVTLSAAMLIPLVVNVFVVGQLTNGIDLTPVALVVSIFVVGRTTFGYRLLDVMPAASSLLFRQHRDGVIVVDTNSRVVDVNPAAEAMLAATMTPGTPAASVVPFWDQVRDLTHEKGAGGIEVAHGNAIIEIRSLLVHGERATVIGRLIVLHDVTERARLVRELTAYARTIAHDLKNPLSGAIGFLGLVRADEPNLDEESERRLVEAEGACHRMVSIIVDLLRTRPARPGPKQQSD